MSKRSSMYIHNVIFVKFGQIMWVIGYLVLPFQIFYALGFDFRCINLLEETKIEPKDIVLH